MPECIAKLQYYQVTNKKLECIDCCAHGNCVKEDEQHEEGTKSADRDTLHGHVHNELH